MKRVLLLTFLSLVWVVGASAGSLKDKLDILDESRNLSQAFFLDGQGEQRQLQDFAGEILLVNFWATWCPPCVKELPSFARLQSRLVGKPVRVIAISEDFGGFDVPRKFLEDKGIEGLTLLLDDKGIGFRSLGGRGLPTTLIVNASGREIARLVGDLEWDSDEVVTYVESLVENK